MEITPDKRKLIGLVEQAFEGRLCLPNFQRDFVWPREDVADLLRSVLRGYFIGSLLLLRCDPALPPFAPAFLKGAQSALKDPRPEYLVLDGQQRLTALLYALTAPVNVFLKDSSQRRWFYLDLDLLIKDPDNDDIVFDRSQRELDGLDKIELQFKRRILPCTQLLRSADFMKWKDELDDWLRINDADQYQRFRTEWRTPWTNAVNDFQNFQVPLVELPQVSETDTKSIGRVCAIFEKLNSTGVELSVYDLLTARLYRSAIKLHQLWAEACKEHKRLADWSEGRADKNKFGVLVLRTLALLRGIDPKPRFLIALKPEGFEADWRRAAAAIERALELITHVGPDGFGVFDKKWLPGYGLLPVLAALRAEIDSRKLGDNARTELRQWYWSNVFLERYSSGVESKSRKDYGEFIQHWTEGGQDPSVFVEARNRIGASSFSIASSASSGSSVYCGVFCLLAIAGARDWRRAEAIELQNLQDHHIFPQAYLKRHGIKNKIDVNSILNRTLISDETNGKIKDSAPAEYIINQDIFPAGKASTLLDPHFLDEKAQLIMGAASESLSEEDAERRYGAFRSYREQRIVTRIREMCGAPELFSGNIAPPDDGVPSDLLTPPTLSQEGEEQEAIPDTPWGKDGPNWHTHERCGELTGLMLQLLVTLFKKHVPDAEVSWSQKTYVAFKLRGVIWGALTTGRRRLELKLWTNGAVFDTADLAKRLGIAADGSPEGAAEVQNKSSVQFGGKGDGNFRIRIRFWDDFDFDKQEFPALLEEWRGSLFKK